MGFPVGIGTVYSDRGLVYDSRLVPLILSGNETYDLVQCHKNCDYALGAEEYDIFRQAPRD